MVPPQLVQWLAQTYPKPQVDAEWLDACYNWVSTECGLNPATDMPAIRDQVEAQLLQSDLSDSMISGTGLPANVSELTGTNLRGPPTLVEIVDMTDIGQSAFSLHNVRQTRIDRADLAGLAEDDGGEDDGPVPRYPRSMLRLQLSDGTTTLNAIEFRKLPELELGETPLGYKMQLKNVPMKRGFAFLEPGNVIMKGHQTADREVDREDNFLRGLHIRLNPDAELPPRNPPPQHDQPVTPPPPAPRPARAAAPQPAPANTRRPPPRHPSPPSRSLSPIAGPSRPRAAAPASAQQRQDTSLEPPPSSNATLVNSTTSSYFATGTSKTSSSMRTLAAERIFSPPRTAAIVADEDDLYASPPRADGSSDYDFGEDVPMDPEMWEKVDEIANKALGTQRMQASVADDVIEIEDDDEAENVPPRWGFSMHDDDDVIEVSD